MHIQFMIERVIYPKTLAEWRDYVIAEVKVLYCSAPHANLKGTIQKFKGKLPSRAPYFIFESKQGCFMGKDPKTHEDMIVAANKTEWTYTRHLTADGLVYILTQEFPLAARQNNNSSMREFTTQRALDDIRRMVQHEGLYFTPDGKIDEDTFQALPIFKEMVARSCDYFRLEYVEPLRLIYDRKARPGASKAEEMERDQMRQLQTMPPAKLVQLHRFASTTPWLLCLRRFSHKLFGMKPISAVNAFRLARRNNVRMNRRYVVGIRVLDHIRRVLYQRDGHTAFPMRWILDSYRTASLENAMDMDQLPDSIDWIIQNGGLMWLQKPDPDNMELHEFEREGVLAFPKTMYQVTTITQVFLNVYTRAHKLKKAPAPRDRDVVKIPPTLTDEQQAAVRHFWNNWLCMTVGPPGRGKTAVIESVFAEVYGICNITFVGTMVASQRERLGGRIESSHTAHSMYKTMRAYDEERRDAYLGQIEVLVWDEFSNVSESLMANVLSCFHNSDASRLCRLLFIFDIHQINPIDPSCCAKDLIMAFPGHTRELTVNLRVDPIYRALADIALQILRNEIDDIAFGHDLMNDDSAVILQAPESVSFGNSFVDSPGYQAVRQAMQYFRIRQGIDNVMDFKFITPKRRTRKAINDAVELILFEEGWINPSAASHRVPLRSGLDLYPGAVLAISGATFKPPKESLGPGFDVDELRNGEVFRVVSYCVYEDPKSRVFGAYYVRGVSRTGKEKCMVLHKDVHVDPICVIKGYCCTIDASQGTEWPVVCGILHDGAADETWITMERLYVLSSRAKQALVLFAPGGRDTLKAIAGRHMPRRYSALGYTLMHNKAFDEAKQPVFPELYQHTELVDPEALELLTDDDVPAVPRFPGRVNPETEGSGPGKRRRVRQ